MWHVSSCGKKFILLWIFYKKCNFYHLVYSDYCLYLYCYIRPMHPSAFFRCFMSNLGAYMEVWTELFFEIVLIALTITGYKCQAIYIFFSSYNIATLSYWNCYHPGWRLMRAGYHTCFHTLYDEKKKSIPCCLPVIRIEPATSRCCILTIDQAVKQRFSEQDALVKISRSSLVADWKCVSVTKWYMQMPMWNSVSLSMPAYSSQLSWQIKNHGKDQLSMSHWKRRHRALKITQNSLQ